MTDLRQQKLEIKQHNNSSMQKFYSECLRMQHSD